MQRPANVPASLQVHCEKSWGFQLLGDSRTNVNFSFACTFLLKTLQEYSEQVPTKRCELGSEEEIASLLPQRVVRNDIQSIRMRIFAKKQLVTSFCVSSVVD
jgi:hypothetical protein